MQTIFDFISKFITGVLHTIDDDSSDEESEGDIFDEIKDRILQKSSSSSTIKCGVIKGDKYQIYHEDDIPDDDYYAEYEDEESEEKEEDEYLCKK
jgi:hypothetical protein